MEWGKRKRKKCVSRCWGGRLTEKIKEDMGKMRAIEGGLGRMERNGGFCKLPVGLHLYLRYITPLVQKQLVE